MPRSTSLSTTWLICIFGWLCCGRAYSQDEQKEGPQGPIVAVFDIEERGAALGREALKDLTDFLAARLAEGGYQVIPRAEIVRRLLDQKRESYRECYDESCQIELGRELAAQKSLSAQLLKVGEKCQLTGVLYDLKKSTTELAATAEGGCSRDSVLESIKDLAYKLCKPVRAALGKEPGFLELRASEEGAEVYIDDVLVGTTPLGKQKVLGGYHKVQVKKEEFLVFGKDVLVEPEKTLELDAVLLRSNDYMQAYESRAGTYRVLAWTFTAVSVAAAGTATGLFVWNEGRRSDYNRDFDAYDPSQDPEGTEKARLEDLADSIDMLNAVNIGLSVVAAAAVGTALYFWIAGDPPGKYEIGKDAAGEGSDAVSWDLGGSVGPGAVGLTATCRF